jgi:nucleoside-diphosphate-sugar epimerase
MNANSLDSDLDHVINHTRDFWEELRGERVFITGGTGFFGCWLLESFLRANARLKLDSRATVLTRSPEAFIAKTPHLALADNVTLLEGDIRTFSFPVEAFSHILHVATETSPQREKVNPLKLFDANIEGTQRILEFADTCRAQKLLFTSSGAVYGKQPSEMTHISEDYLGAPITTEPGTAYGQSKRAAEFLCAAQAQDTGGLQVKIARCFAFVGPWLPLDSNFAIGNFIRDALHGGPIEINGDGTPYRSFLYAADLAIWLWTIFFRGQSCHPYNVGSEDDLSIAELAREVARVVSPDVTIQIAKQPLPNQPVERYVPMTQRAKTDLGLEVIIKLPDAIRRTVNWYTSS